MTLITDFFPFQWILHNKMNLKNSKNDLLELENEKIEKIVVMI